MASGYVIKITIDASGTVHGSKEAKRALKGVAGGADKTDKSVSKMEQSMKRAAVAMAAMAAAGAAIAIAAIVKVTKESITAFIEQARVVKQVEAVLVATGGAAGVTSDELQGMASSLQQVTAFGDEAILGMQGVLLSFRNIGSEVFERTTVAIMDLSTLMGTDLQSSAIMLGKALNDPVIGMTAMSRAGITFSESQKQMVKDLVASNKMLEAQDVILTEVEAQVGGLSKAYRGTLGGSLDALGNSYGDLLEEIGRVISDSGNLIDLIEKMIKVIDSAAGSVKGFSVLFVLGINQIRMDIIDLYSDILTVAKGVVDLAAKAEAIQNIFKPKALETNAWSSLAIELDMVSANLDELKKKSGTSLAKFIIDTGKATKEAKDLGDAVDEIDIEKLIREQIKINALLELEVDLGQSIQDSIDESLEIALQKSIEEADLADSMGKVLSSAMETAWSDGILFPTSGPPSVAGAPGGGGGGDAASTAASTIVQLTQAMDGMSDSTKQLVGVFANMASAMATTKVTANDWITMVVQIFLIILDMGKKSRAERERARKEFAKAAHDVTKASNRHLAEARELLNKYSEIREKLAKIGDFRLKDAMAAYEQEQRIMALRQNQEAQQGMIGLLENLALYSNDARIADELRRAQLQLEIASLWLQFEQLKQMGYFIDEMVRSTATLGDHARILNQVAEGGNQRSGRSPANESFLELQRAGKGAGEGLREVITALDEMPIATANAGESMEDFLLRILTEVTEGLENGTFDAGGKKGGRRPSRPSGPNPRDTFAQMIETAQGFASIMEDTFGDMATHFAEMRAHVAKMRLSEEERATLVRQISDLERQASEQYGFELLEKVYQATNDTQALADLEKIRFNVERAHTLAQIQMLIASGTLSEQMTSDLQQAAEALAGFNFGDIPPKSDWDSLLAAIKAFSAVTTDAERLQAAFDAAMDDLITSGTATFEKWVDAWEAAQESAESMALSMIDSLARAVGSEEDMKDVARIRHQMEVASLRMQAQILQQWLDPDTFATLERLIDAFELMDPTAGIGGGSSSSGGSSPVVTAIEDQTDSLLAGWQSLMDSLLVGSDSPLTPQQRVDYLQEQYNRLFALARSGDQAAESQLQQMIPSLVSAMELLTGGTATTAFQGFFQGLISDISLLSGLSSPLTGLGYGGGGTASTDNVIGSLIDFQQSSESSADQAHEDSEELREEFAQMGQKLDLVLAQLPPTGTG